MMLPNNEVSLLLPTLAHARPTHQQHRREPSAGCAALAAAQPYGYLLRAIHQFFVTSNTLLQMQAIGSTHGRTFHTDGPSSNGIHITIATQQYGDGQTKAKQ